MTDTENSSPIKNMTPDELAQLGPINAALQPHREERLRQRQEEINKESQARKDAVLAAQRTKNEKVLKEMGI